MDAPTSALQQHVAGIDSAKPPFERLLVVDRLADDHLGQPSLEPAVAAIDPESIARSSS